MEKNKRKDIASFFFSVSTVVLINIICSQFFFRIDLTEEKRYTISQPTRQLLRDLNDVVFVEVYLDGDLPAGFKRLQTSIREVLDEFRVYGGENIQYKFRDPAEGLTGNDLRDQYANLAKKGLQPTNLMIAEEGGGKREKIIFPGAIVNFRGRELAVLLLKGNQSLSPDMMLNQSIEGAEYELASAIRRLNIEKKKKIGFVLGHGEYDELRTQGAMNTLREFYDVERINLPEQIEIKGLDAIIVAGPDSAFNDPDIYKIDQFLIKGGKAMFFIDPMRVHIDSIGEKGTYSFPYELRLDDFLFHLGVRINKDLIQDIYCAPIPMFVGYDGDKPRTQLVSWKFYPIINNFSNHPISKNLDAIRLQFVSSIDTVKAAGIKKTPLMFTSKNSRVLPSPVRLNFNEVRMETSTTMFNKGPIPVAYVLEGTYESFYKGRLAESTQKQFNFVEKDKPTKIVVVSDASIIANEVNNKGTIRALGFDRFTGITFANQSFIQNAMDYLLDDSGVIFSRNKQILLRPLDKSKISSYGKMLRYINVIVPILLIILYGVVRHLIRKKKYQYPTSS